MYSVIETEQFAHWVDGLRDMPTRIWLPMALELQNEQDQNPPV